MSNDPSTITASDSDSAMRYCPSCKETTKQVKIFHDPNDTEALELIVWQCSKCLNNTGFVD